MLWLRVSTPKQMIFLRFKISDLSRKQHFCWRGCDGKVKTTKITPSIIYKQYLGQSLVRAADTFYFNNEIILSKTINSFCLLTAFLTFELKLKVFVWGEGEFFFDKVVSCGIRFPIM